MKKRISIVLILALLVSTIILPAHAATPTVYQETEIIHTEYGDIQVQTSLVIHNSLLRSSSISADRTYTYIYEEKQIAEVTLSASFGYNGTLAWVTRASSSHSTSDGWNYKDENITASDGTATLTASMTKFLYPTIPVELSLTCSPDGEIS